MVGHTCFRISLHQFSNVVLSNLDLRISLTLIGFEVVLEATDLPPFGELLPLLTFLGLEFTVTVESLLFL